MNRIWSTQAHLHLILLLAAVGCSDQSPLPFTPRYETEITVDRISLYLTTEIGRKVVGEIDLTNGLVIGAVDTPLDFQPDNERHQTRNFGLIQFIDDHVMINEERLNAQETIFRIDQYRAVISKLHNLDPAVDFHFLLNPHSGASKDAVSLVIDHLASENPETFVIRIVGRTRMPPPVLIQSQTQTVS